MNNKSHLFHSRRHLHLYLVLIALVPFALSLFGGYCYDDVLPVKECKAIEHFGSISKLFSHSYGPTFRELSYRPVGTLTYFIDGIIFHKIPALSRLFNLLLHMAVGLLLFNLWRILFRNNRIAFIASALFLIHPITTEVVNCSGFREDILALLFMLLAMLSLNKARADGNILHEISAALFWLLALLSKETSIVLLALAPMVYFAPVAGGKWADLRKELTKPNLRIAGLFAFVFLLFLFLYTNLSYKSPISALKNGAAPMQETAIKSAPSNQPTIAEPSKWPGAKGPVLGFLNFAKSFTRYLRLWFYPVGLSINPDFKPSGSYSDPRLWLGLALFLIFTALSLVTYFKGKIIGVGGLWVFFSLAPIMQLLPTPQFFAERYFYMAHAGMSLALASILVGKGSLSRIRVVVVGAIFLILISLTILRNRDWLDDVTLNIRAYEQWDNAEGKVALGALYYGKREMDTAEKYFREAIKMDPLASDAYRNIGVIFLEKGEKETARPWLEQAFKIAPENPRNQKALEIIRK